MTEEVILLLKAGLWQAGKEWYHFQPELMVSKMVVKLLLFPL